MSDGTLKPAKAPPNGLSDPNRLAALDRTKLMDSATEEVFDRATRLATQITGRPVALLSLVDDSRQFFKSAIGLDEGTAQARQTPLTHSLCQHVVSSGAPLLVTDALRDKRQHVRTNGSVADMGLRAYYGVPVRSPEGDVLGAFCAIDKDAHVWTDDQMTAMQDITAMIEVELNQRRLVAEKSMLLAELNHRIKNIFTVTSSLVRMTARGSDSVDDMAQTLGTRLAALDIAQSLALSSSNDPGADQAQDDTVDLRELFEKITGPYDKTRIRLNGDDISISPRAATAFALIFHELATNATKYGALSEAGGQLTIDWTMSDQDLKLVWREKTDQAPTQTGPVSDGFGSQLIDMNLRYELNGDIQRTFDDTGIHVEMQIPLESLQS